MAFQSDNIFEKSDFAQRQIWFSAPDQKKAGRRENQKLQAKSLAFSAPGQSLIIAPNSREMG
jgi:hypothetical protein